MNKFEAMYYPYATIQNKETLKLSLLYFDKIHILSPYEPIGKKDLYQVKEVYKEINTELNDEQLFKPLYNIKYIKEGNYPSRPFIVDKDLKRAREIWERKSSSENIIISIIDPEEIFEKHFKDFIESVLEDLKDDYFKELAKRKKWILWNEKTPSISVDYFNDKIKAYKSDATLVDGDLAESILLNYAIFASIDKKLTPFTDELEHSRLLNRKMQRNYELIKHYLLEEGYIEDIKQNLLTKKVLEINLSGVEGVSYSDILDFRDDFKSELKSFRTEMGRITNSISSKPWTSEFDSEVAQIIKSEINPKVQVLEDQSKEFKDKMLVKYGKKVIPLAISLGAMLYAGVPLSLAVIGSTLLDKLRGESIYDIILDDWKDWRHQNRNSLTYLFNLNKLSL